MRLIYHHWITIRLPTRKMDGFVLNSDCLTAMDPREKGWRKISSVKQPTFSPLKIGLFGSQKQMSFGPPKNSNFQGSKPRGMATTLENFHGGENLKITCVKRKIICSPNLHDFGFKMFQFWDSLSFQGWRPWPQDKSIHTPYKTNSIFRGVVSWVHVLQSEEYQVAVFSTWGLEHHDCQLFRSIQPFAVSAFGNPKGHPGENRWFQKKNMVQ